MLPDFIDVIDDPALKTFEGKDLVGAYDVDDEGVPAQAVKLVADGHLENYLLGREPVRDFPESNGHGRAGAAGPARPAIGVMKVTAQDGLSDEELNARLIDMAKDRGLKSVYYVETLGAKQPRGCSFALTSTASANWCAARCSTISTSALCAQASRPPARISGSPTTSAKCPRPCSLRRCCSATSPSSAPTRRTKSCRSIPRRIKRQKPGAQVARIWVRDPSMRSFIAHGWETTKMIRWSS